MAGTESLVNEKCTKSYQQNQGHPVFLEHQQNEDACPSPVVRPSHDGCRPRTNPRTRAPPFQQSKRWPRWARTHGVESPRPKTSNAVVAPALRRQLSLNCSNSRQSALSIESRIMDGVRTSSDTDVVQRKGLCRPASVPSCHHLLQTHANIYRSTSRSNMKRSTPQRKRSARMMLSETNTSPKRAVLPRRVKRRSRIANIQTVQILQNAMGIKSSHVSVQDMALEQDGEHGIAMIQPKESWRTEAGVNAWSAENAICWDDKPFDFNNDWKPEPLTLGDGTVPQKLAPQHSQVRGSNGVITENVAPASPFSNSGTTPMKDKRKAMVGPEPPERTSSRGISVARSVTLDIVQLGCPPVVVESGVTGSEANNVGDAGTNDSPRTSKRNERRLHSSRVPSSSRTSKFLKNTKSMDSLAQIEAHLMSPVGAHGKNKAGIRVSTLPKAKEHSLQHSPSKSGSTAGQPPVRPLPGLPIGFVKLQAEHIDHDLCSASDDETESVLIHRDTNISRRQSQMSQILTLASMDDNTTKPVQCQVIMPRPPSRSAKDTAAEKGLAVSITEPSLNSATLLPTPSSIYSQESRRSLRRSNLMIKDIATERSDKIRELKKKHIAAITRSKENMQVLLQNEEDNNQGDATRVVYTDVRKIIRPPPPSMPPPPPPPPPVSLQSTSQMMSATGHERKVSDDMFSLFPNPGSSRPASRASGTTLISTSAIARSGSVKRASPFRTRSKAGSARTRRGSLPKELKDKQILGPSSIMIMCDTDPHSDNFRAGAISPIASIHGSDRSVSPRKSKPKRKIVERRPASPLAQSGLVNIDEIATFDQSEIVNKHISLKSLSRQQSGAAMKESVSGIGNKHVNNLGRASPASSRMRPPSNTARYIILNSDSEENGDSPTRELTPISINQRAASVRSGSRTSVSKSRATRRREKALAEALKADSPETVRLEVEDYLRGMVRRADQGNAQAQQILDKYRGVLHRAVQNEQVSPCISRAKTMSAVEKKSKSALDEASTSRSAAQRPKSAGSVLTTTGTDTDGSAPLQSGCVSSPSKRASAGSLTDPTDYDVVNVPKPLQNAVKTQETTATSSTNSSRTVQEPQTPTKPPRNGILSSSPTLSPVCYTETPRPASARVVKLQAPPAINAPRSLKSKRPYTAPGASIATSSDNGSNVKAADAIIQHNRSRTCLGNNDGRDFSTVVRRLDANSPIFDDIDLLTPVAFTRLSGKNDHSDGDDTIGDALGVRNAGTIKYPRDQMSNNSKDCDKEKETKEVKNPITNATSNTTQAVEDGEDDANMNSEAVVPVEAINGLVEGMKTWPELRGLSSVLGSGVTISHNIDDIETRDGHRERDENEKKGLRMRKVGRVLRSPYLYGGSGSNRSSGEIEEEQKEELRLRKALIIGEG